MRQRSPARHNATGRRMRGLVAALAVLVNAMLPAGWELAFAGTAPFGDTYSICLAAGGTIQDRPRPAGAPVSPAGSLHCHLCLLPGPPVSAAQEADPTFVPLPAAARVRYAPVPAAPVSAGTAGAFEARAPPA